MNRILSFVALQYLLEESVILSAPRGWLIQYKFFRDLFSCPYCLGFWSAAAAVLLPDIANKWLQIAGLNIVYQKVKDANFK